MQKVGVLEGEVFSLNGVLFFQGSFTIKYGEPPFSVKSQVQSMQTIRLPVEQLPAALTTIFFGVVST